MKKVNMDFGKYAFTDKDENEEVAKTAIKIQKGKHEENTTQENDILNKISDWLYRSDNKTSQKIKELKPIFDVAKKKYPKIFNPKQGVKLLYRGVAELRKEKDIPQDISSYTYVDLGGKNFYLSNQPFDYKPSRDTQSWTSDIEKATSFAQDAMLITLVGNDFYFNSDLIDSIFMEERETIHIGKKFEHKVFVALSPSLYYELVEKNTRKPKKAIDEINKLKFANGGTMESIGDGGITYGKSHAEGGIKVYNKGTGQMLEVEGGESVVNKKTMAMKDKVDLNGEKMTPCEAISELNQMGGGVAFECSDVEGKKYKMADGGELQKGIQQEMEHAKTFEKLYRHKITPKEAPAEIAKEHLMEDEDYYKDLRKIRHSCSCQKHRRKMMDGGIFDKGFGSLDSFMENFEKKMDEDEKKEIIDETISVGREMLDHDYKSVIMERIEPSLQKYFAHLNHANLYKSGWRLQFGTSKRWAGLCSSKPKTNEKGIFISIDFVKHDKNWLQNYKDVVYHEMAHAMVVQFIPQVNSIDPFHEGQEGHGMVWTNVCKALNPEGVCERYYKNSNFAESFKDYMYSCRTCGAKKYGNTRAFTDICFKCKSPVIVVRNK